MVLAHAFDSENAAPPDCFGRPSSDNFETYRCLVEAGGVEPPSEKARREEPTCVAGSEISATASEPARAAAA